MSFLRGTNYQVVNSGRDEEAEVFQISFQSKKDTETVQVTFSSFSSLSLTQRKVLWFQFSDKNTNTRRDCNVATFLFLEGLKKCLTLKQPQKYTKLFIQQI